MMGYLERRAVHRVMYAADRKTQGAEPRQPFDTGHGPTNTGVCHAGFGFSLT